MNDGLRLMPAEANKLDKHRTSLRYDQRTLLFVVLVAVATIAVAAAIEWIAGMLIPVFGGATILDRFGTGVGAPLRWDAFDLLLGAIEPDLFRWSAALLAAVWLGACGWLLLRLGAWALEPKDPAGEVSRRGRSGSSSPVRPG